MELTVRSTEPRHVPSIYFSDAYGEAEARHRNGRWITIADDGGGWQVPLIVRDMERRVLDATTPYGYSGIHIDDSLHGAEISEMWAQTKALMADLGIASVFMRFAPFAPLSDRQLALLDGLEVIDSARTILVPTRDVSLMWDAMRGRARTAIRKAHRCGYRASIARADQSLVAPTHPFRELYYATMRRLNASPHYYFGDEYYDRLLSSAADSVQFASVLDKRGEVASAAVVLMDRSRAHYHLAASTPGALRDGVNSLLIWSILQWCERRRLSDLHLGGGVRRNDGLYKFKDSFGGDALPFYTGRLIVDPDRYRQLVARRADDLGCSPEELEASGYFPAYRAERLSDE